jgi:hypothetical protein
MIATKIRLKIAGKEHFDQNHHETCAFQRPLNWRMILSRTQLENAKNGRCSGGIL